MISTKCKIGIYDWAILYCQIQDNDDIKKFHSASGKMGIIPGDIDEIESEIGMGRHGGGKCYENDSCRTLIILMYPTLNEANFYSSFAHEIYHCAYSITKWAGIDDEEAMAYLIGYIWELLYNKIKV